MTYRTDIQISRKLGEAQSADEATETISLDDSRANALREWLNAWDKRYAVHPVTDNQLAAWLTEAEESGGDVEIPDAHSVTGAPLTFRV
jgi:hypothetical protein